jgi:hypothetical protein
VSRNVAGTSDVNAIWNYFNRDATDASSNYIIDAEGNCIYAVPESAKAWTQGAMNPYSISIEFIGTGAASDWTNAALAKGAQVFASAAKRWGIPARWGSAPSCTVLRSGILDHDALGCGNTHTDVGPYFPDGAFVGRVSTLLAPPPPAKAWRVTVDPYGAAGPKQVWSGIAQPAAVTAKRPPDGWAVLVDPNGPRDAATVWTGRYEPVALGLPRGK